MTRKIRAVQSATAMSTSAKARLAWNAFRRLLNDPRTEHAAFIAETPIEEPGDDLRNIETLKSLVEVTKAPAKRKRA